MSSSPWSGSSIPKMVVVCLRQLSTLLPAYLAFNLNLTRKEQIFLKSTKSTTTPFDSYMNIVCPAHGLHFQKLTNHLYSMRAAYNIHATALNMRTLSLKLYARINSTFCLILRKIRDGLERWKYKRRLEGCPGSHVCERKILLRIFGGEVVVPLPHFFS